MTAKHEDDFWNASSIKGMNLDDDEDFIKSTSSLLLESTEFENIFSSELVGNNANVLPIHSLITKKNLDLVLDDVQLPIHSEVLPVKDTINKMFLGQPFVLHPYRSITHKVELLDNAINIMDGNIILNVVLFLSETLKSDVFYRCLITRNVALKHYVNYLSCESKLQELQLMNIAAGHYPKVMELFCLSSKSESDRKQLYQILQKFISEYGGKLNSTNKLILTDLDRFLEWQVARNMHCSSVIEQLANLCKTHWENSSGRDDKEIIEFKKRMKISNFQFEWIQINTLASLGMWKKLKEMFIKPNWLTKNTIKSVISPELFVSTIYKHDAPKDIIEEFLLYVVDTDVSLNLGKKMQCHRFVIDSYVLQRDKLSLTAYAETLPSQSDEYFYARNSLDSPDKRWKN